MPLIEFTAVHAQQRDGACLLDLRTPHEHQRDTIPGAINIPRDELDARWQELPEHTLIICFCRSGMRSPHATRFLRQHGLNAVTLRGGFTTWQSAGYPTTQEITMYDDITPHELQQRQAHGAQIIDVREDWEYQSAHIPGARNIPLSELPARTDDLTGPVILVCASGNRSARAAQYLSEHGVKDVANLLGGTSGWIAQGLPTE